MNNNYKELQQKENYYNEIKSKLNDYDVAINLSVNAIGKSKNSNHSKLLVSYFDKHISFEGAEKVFSLNTWCGPQITYYLKDVNAKELKEEMIDLEDNHPLGRFVDLDVYSKEKKSSFSRSGLRKCYLCDDPAFVCQRTEKHRSDELISYFEHEIESYFKQLIKELIERSMLMELNLEYKFGLVTPTSKGSHHDMDYNLMVKAIEPVSSYLSNMFINALKIDNLDELVKTNQEVGIKAEQEMLKVTNGVNCYKGLIYNLGLVITALSQIILKNMVLNELFDVIIEIAKRTLIKDEIETYGLYAYEKLNFGGIRKEALTGMPNLKQAFNQLTSFDELALRKTLVQLIINLEDSVFLKRSKTLSKMREHQEKFITLNINDYYAVKELNDYCIEKQLSFGGAADLLVVTIFMKKYLKLFSLNKT